MGKQTVVVGAPVFNEEENISVFLSKIDHAAESVMAQFPDLSIEVLLVNDGSTDKTVELIHQFQAKKISKIKLCQFSRNYGHTAAVCALVNEARGNALILMDADLQDDPQFIIELIRKWQLGSLSIRVKRGKRKEGALFSFLSNTFYWFYGKLSGLQSHLGIFGLYDQRVVESLRQLPEVVRYHPGLLSLVGFKTDYIEIDRLKRLHGESRVGFLRLIKLANQAIFSFSTIPILLVTLVGLVISLTSFAAGILVIGVRIFSDLAIPGWASILGVQLFLTGLVIFSLGVIGQYIAIIVEEVKRRPKYFLESIAEIECKH